MIVRPPAWTTESGRRHSGLCADLAPCVSCASCVFRVEEINHPWVLSRRR